MTWPEILTNISPMTRIKSSLAIFSLLFLFLFPISSEAAGFKSSAWTQEEKYVDKIRHKLGFGILNVSVGWTSILYEPYYTGWWGLATGPINAVLNTGEGAIHAVTFPIPVDLPLPEGGISYEYNR